MEAELEDTLSTKKVMMHSRPFIGVFKIQLLQTDQPVCVFFYLFSGSPCHNNKNKFSYSMVGKIEGLRNLQAHTEIISDYGAGRQLKDLLHFEQNQFIFSNQSLDPATFQLSIKMKGALPRSDVFSASLNIRLKYTLRKIYLISVATQTVTKPVPSLSLFQ